MNDVHHFNVSVSLYFRSRRIHRKSTLSSKCKIIVPGNDTNTSWFNRCLTECINETRRIFCELIQVYKCFEASPAPETHLWNMLLWSWYELYGCMAVVSEQCVNGQFYVITTYENTEQYIQLFHFFRTTPYFIMNLYYN